MGGGAIITPIRIEAWKIRKDFGHSKLRRKTFRTINTSLVLYMYRNMSYLD